MTLVGPLNLHRRKLSQRYVQLLILSTLPVTLFFGYILKLSTQILNLEAQSHRRLIATTLSFQHSIPQHVSTVLLNRPWNNEFRLL